MHHPKSDSFEDDPSYLANQEKREYWDGQNSEIFWQNSEIFVCDPLNSSNRIKTQD